jgi:hypothetical protein
MESRKCLLMSKDCIGKRCKILKAKDARSKYARTVCTNIYERLECKITFLGRSSRITSTGSISFRGLLACNPRVGLFSACGHHTPTEVVYRPT